ncbi:Sec-independent protein translocase subunit TatA/TatB [Halorussus marinus]|uniref:Sec-independent protein translocase subunit TatA/TatB n=1 Tax=Halorussus marinus TaxID=2505976 RepID=UPI0010926B69|nr:twin-arginine translocase TatA/TatE family subunit [Halorussus marinus]
MQPGFIGGIPGRIEIGGVLILGILLFGADRIPRLARSVGESIGELRCGRETIEDELQDDDED